MATRNLRPRALAAAVTAVAAVGAGLAVTGRLPATAATAAAPPAAISWGVCPPPHEGDTSRDPRQECGTLRVPLDYRAPQGRSIEIAVSRIRAADPAKRAGVLMLNGGGPGPSLDVPSVAAPFLPAEVRERYDLVGFDPRGIAHSTPMSCGRDADELVRDEELLVLSFPAANGSIARNADYSRRTAEKCAKTSGDLLPYLSTVNIARDMDRIRGALGERSVSYYGLSWGTYLGSVYRAMFPRSVDRMVLDSSVDPGKRGYEDFRTFSGAVEDRWPDLARFGVEQRKLVGLGGTERQVRRNYLAVTAKLDRDPVTLPGTKALLTGNLVRMFTWQLSYSDAALTPTEQAPVPPMAQLWRAAVHFAHGKGTAEDRAVIEGLTNGFVAQGTLPGVPQDNLYSVGYAVSCADEAWPRDLRMYARNTAKDRARHPLTAGAPANVTPCSYWPVQPVEPAATVTSTGARNVLILQNRRDPSTPLSTARAMRRALGGDASLVTVEAGGHGVLIHPEQNTCAMGTMKAYLTEGELPRGDRRCA